MKLQMFSLLWGGEPNLLSLISARLPPQKNSWHNGGFPGFLHGACQDVQLDVYQPRHSNILVGKRENPFSVAMASPPPLLHFSTAVRRSLVSISLQDISAGSPFLQKIRMPTSKFRNAHQKKKKKKKTAEKILHKDSYWQQENDTFRYPSLTGLIFE